MKPKDAIETINAARAGVNSVLADRLFGDAEEAVEALLEDNSPAPTFTKSTRTAAEQADCDSYIRKIKTQQFLPGPETVIDGGEEVAPPRVQKSALDRLGEMIVQRLEANLPHLTEAFARKMKANPIPLMKNAGGGASSANRIEVDVIDGVKFISEYDPSGALCRSRQEAIA